MARHRPDRREARLAGLLPWVNRLTGLEEERVREAAATISAWPIPKLAQRFASPASIDDAARAVLLAEDVELLVSRGVPENKLMAKLKDIGQFEATWAEIRATGVIVKTSPEEIEPVLEEGKAQGKHADLRLVYSDPPHQSIEIKSVGLSAAEVEFCQRMSASLDVVIPPHGMVVIDAPLDGKPPRWSPAHVDHNRREAARTAAANPFYPAGMASATIFARGGEANYVRRAATRIIEATAQLPVTDDSLVCLYWTNGASIPDVVDALDWREVPAHVAGLIFVGQLVAFPHRNIDVFRIQLMRGWRRGDPVVTDSALDDEFARLILQRAQSSSGVRATLIRGEVRGKKRQLLRRDGGERIPPFNLLLDKDLRPRDAVS